MLSISAASDKRFLYSEQVSSALVGAGTKFDAWAVELPVYVVSGIAQLSPVIEASRTIFYSRLRRRTTRSEKVLF